MKYEKPEADVMKLENEDIMTSSGCVHGNSKRCNHQPGKNNGNGKGGYVGWNGAPDRHVSAKYGR